MKFLINFATRSRPEKFFRGIESIENNLSGKHDYEIIATLDEDDETMVNDEVLKKMRGIKNLTYYVGKSKDKIEAINRSIPQFADKQWDVLINMSDDMIFTKKNFDDVIAREASKVGGTDFYFHFRDINHKKQDVLCTLHIVGRDYFERDGFIYHPKFISVYADNYNDDVAKKRGKYHFFPTVIFDHLHCAYRKSERDEQYQRTEDRKVYAIDRKTYRRLMKTEFRYA